MVSLGADPSTADKHCVMLQRDRKPRADIRVFVRAMPSVLVASDDRNIAGLIALNLEKRGYSAVTCDVRAGSLASRLGGDFDLVVIDLPQEDLEAVSPALAAVPQAPRIILCEASLSRARLARLGGAVCITRPFDMDRLLEAVRVIVSHAE